MVRQLEEKISQLTDQLKCNDGYDFEEMQEIPPPPTDPMEALEKIGSPAVEALVNLALEKPSYYSADYATEILGRIHDPRIPSLLLTIMDAFQEVAYTSDSVIFAMKQQGPEALELFLQYAVTARKNKDERRWLGAMEGLEFQLDTRVADELLLGLQAFDEILEATISLLAEQGDRRAVDSIVTILMEEPDFEEAKLALRKLLSPSVYRPIFENLGILGPERYKTLATQLERAAREFKWLCDLTIWEGDDAEQLNDLILRRKQLALYCSLVGDLHEIIADEGFLHEAEPLKEAEKRFLDSFTNVLRERDDLQTAVNLSVNEDVHLVKEATGYRYPGLARGQVDGTPHLRRLAEQLIKWLRDHGFCVSWQTFAITDHTLFARRGVSNALQACIVGVGTKSSERGAGRVVLSIPEGGWTDVDATSFESDFWKTVDALVQVILGRTIKKKRADTE